MNEATTHPDYAASMKRVRDETLVWAATTRRERQRRESLYSAVVLARCQGAEPEAIVAALLQAQQKHGVVVPDEVWQAARRDEPA